MKASPELAARLLQAAKNRIGMEGYARMLGSLHTGPMSTATLAEKHQVSHLLVLAVMRHCLRAGIVHRVDWHRPAPHSRLVPCWALGADGDISMPMYEEKTRRPRRAQSTLILLTTALQLLAEHPHTRAELAEALCMHIETAARIIAALHSNRLIHVASWHKPAIGTTVQEFAAGNRRDAPRPARTSKSAATFRQYRERRQQREMLHALAGAVVQPMRAAA